MNNKHLLFRAFPVTPERVMDRVIDLYQSKNSISKKLIASKVTKEFEFFISESEVSRLIEFARDNCGVRPCSAESKFDLTSKMRFFQKRKND